MSLKNRRGEGGGGRGGGGGDEEEEADRVDRGCEGKWERHHMIFFISLF